MNAKELIRPLLHDRKGRGTSLLGMRVRLTKFAATRGWVIPFLTVRNGIAENWRKARKGDGIGYQHYLEIDEGSQLTLNEITGRTAPDSRILDLGCNVGREMNHLWEKGYRNLTGVEIGEDPFVCAQRELIEETGYKARRWKKLFPRLK